MCKIGSKFSYRALVEINVYRKRGMTNISAYPTGYSWHVICKMHVSLHTKIISTMLQCNYYTTIFSCIYHNKCHDRPSVCISPSYYLIFVLLQCGIIGIPTTMFVLLRWGVTLVTKKRRKKDPFPCLIVRYFWRYVWSNEWTKFYEISLI